MTRAIVAVDHSPRIGGATRMLLTALDALDRGRFHAIVACNEGPVAAEARAHGHAVAPLDLPVLSFAGGVREMGRSVIRFSRAALALSAIVRRERPVALYAHGLASALYGSFAASSRRVPLVWHVHEIVDARGRMWPFVRLAAAAAREIVCVSQATSARLASFGVARRKLSVAYNALPTDLAGGASGTDAGTTADAAGPVLVAAGAVTPGKGHDVLVQAMAEIVRDAPAAIAVIVGEPLLDGDRGHADRLRALAARLGIADRVVFAGFRRDVALLVSRATVVVHPSTCEESFALVPLEAMAAGVPVVASRVGGIPEIVADGVSGLLVPPGDPRALSAAILELLADPERRARMGAEGRRASRAFSRSRMLSGLNEAFARAAGDAPFLVDAS